MKKLLACIITALILLTINPIQSMAANEVNPMSTPTTKVVDTEKVNGMINRLNEIDAMDKTSLSSSEKRVLRKEVRSIKREIQRDSGVYVSVGALLLIIILLIVLL
jgi:hypothetical protein